MECYAVTKGGNLIAKSNFLLCIIQYINNLGGHPKTATEKSHCFPFLAHLKDSGAANAMTRYLHDVYKRDGTNDLWPQICGTGLRVGAANTLFSSGVESIFAIMRGGWDHSGYCKAFWIP